MIFHASVSALRLRRSRPGLRLMRALPPMENPQPIGCVPVAVKVSIGGKRHYRPRGEPPGAREPLAGHAVLGLAVCGQLVDHRLCPSPPPLPATRPTP